MEISEAMPIFSYRLPQKRMSHQTLDFDTVSFSLLLYIAPKLQVHVVYILDRTQRDNQLVPKRMLVLSQKLESLLHLWICGVNILTIVRLCEHRHGRWTIPVDIGHKTNAQRNLRDHWSGRYIDGESQIRLIWFFVRQRNTRDSLVLS